MLKQKRSNKVKNKNSVNVENTAKHHRRENNVSGATQTSFRAKFKATSNKLGQKRHLYIATKTLCAPRVLLFSKILNNSLKYKLI